MILHSLNFEKSDETRAPAYFRLQNLLKAKIEAGQWKPEKKIPSERVLSETYQVSAGTVKKAILIWLNRGISFESRVGERLWQEPFCAQVASDTIECSDISAKPYDYRKSYCLTNKRRIFSEI